MNFERSITFRPAYDKRSSDPAKNYGIGSVRVRFVLKGSSGAVQFVLVTNWFLPHIQLDLDRKYRDHEMFCHPDPTDLGYHSPTPRYEGQTSMGECDLLDGECYYDGSGLNAEPIYQRLLRDGHEGVWEELEAYYAEVFEA